MITRREQRSRKQGESRNEEKGAIMTEDLEVQSSDVPTSMALLIDDEPEPDLPRARNSLLKGSYTMMGVPWTVPTTGPSVPSAALHLLFFNGNGTFSGQINLRVGGALLTADVIGDYRLWKNQAIGVIEGRLRALVPAFRILNSFYLIRRTRDEIDMVLKSGDSLVDSADVDSRTIFNVTLKRVPYNFWDWF
jgi:hypothetical protein